MPTALPAMLEGHTDIAPTQPKKARGSRGSTSDSTSRRAKFVNMDTSGEDWRHEAACLEEDPELFFPIGNTGPALLQIEEAKAVCRRCTVAEVCLKWAMDTGQHYGVWGGNSEDERRRLQRRQSHRIRVRDSES